MAKAIQRIVLKDFKGIDRREGAPPNSFWDLCNLWPKNGELIQAPTPNEGKGLATGITRVHSMLEYVMDSRFEDSHHNSIIVVSDPNSYYQQKVSEVYYVSTSGAGSTTSLKTLAVGGARVRGVMHKMVHSSRYVTEYMPCLVMVDGKNKPFVYHQYNGTGTVASLVAASGNITGTAYLDEPPIAKHCAVFKERLFFANSEGAENRLYWTDLDSAEVWVANVWPAAYNMDVGYGESITNLLVFKGIMYIFTDKALWALSGEGQQGLWNLSKLADIGANEDCVVAAGDLIFFANQNGAYVFAGGQVKKVSDPVSFAWERNFFVNSATFMSEFGLVIFSLAPEGFVFSYGYPECLFMVLDVNTLQWFRIGMPSKGYYSFGNEEELGHSVLFESKTGVLGSKSLIYIPESYAIQKLTTGDFDGGYPILATTNDIGADSSESIIRDVTLSGGALGGTNEVVSFGGTSAELFVVPLADGRSVPAEVTRGLTVNTDYCRITSMNVLANYSFITSACSMPVGTNVVVVSEDSVFPCVHGSVQITSVKSISSTKTSIKFSVRGPSNLLVYLPSFMSVQGGWVIVDSSKFVGFGSITAPRGAGAYANRSKTFGMVALAERDDFTLKAGFNKRGRKFRIAIVSRRNIEEHMRSNVRLEEINVGLQVLGRMRVAG